MILAPVAISIFGDLRETGVSGVRSSPGALTLGTRLGRGVLCGESDRGGLYIVSQWSKKASGSKDSAAPPGDSGESNEQAQSRSSDPAVVGLCRGMVGLSLALLVGLMTLAWVLLRSDISIDEIGVSEEAGLALEIEYTRQ